MSARVIITAAAGGIGRVIAQAFLDQGAKVAICDVDAAAVAACGEVDGLHAAVVDLGDSAAIGRWLDDAVEWLGGVDVLVNNAGTKGPTAMVEDVTLDEWRACLTVSLESHFLCAAHVAPLMKAQGSGSIINISSTAGLYGYGMRTPYAVAKWGVIGLTKSLAVELGVHGVRCNAICPGSVSGERMQRVIAAEAEHRGVAASVVTDEYLSGQSIKRFVDPQEVADMCLFLASPASRMVSGQAIAVDGHTEAFHL